MRRRKKKSVGQPSYASIRPEGESLYIRLCHVCLHLSESGHPIIQCQECQRFLTIEPLVEEHLMSQQDEDVEEKQHGEIRGGLQGLAVLW